ncbi:hypothetical protein D3C85_1540460 [compost metagenome]
MNQPARPPSSAQRATERKKPSQPAVSANTVQNAFVLANRRFAGLGPHHEQFLKLQGDVLVLQSLVDCAAFKIGQLDAVSFQDVLEHPVALVGTLYGTIRHMPSLAR